MCKHILFTNFDASTDLKTLSDFANKTNENDGYGSILRYQDGTIETLKSLNQGQFYIQVMIQLNKKPVKDLVVHHRTSTNESGIEYSHPFEFQGNVMTHNGVVSVPGVHETKTANDSEALLHHLIKTNYDTEAVSGYFSCFILNKNETTILIDDIAPIYSDGRIFSSHKLNEEWARIELIKITLGMDGTSKSIPIKVTKSSYGSDKAHLSLGWDSSGIDAKYTAATNVDDFLYFISPQDERDLLSCENDTELKTQILLVADFVGVALSEAEINEIMEYFGDVSSYEHEYGYKFNS
jgi:hypothetical protein